MDSSSSTSSAALGTRSYRKPSIPAASAPAPALSSSKLRKPPASAGSKHFPKIHSSTSKLPSPPQKHSEKRAETDNLQTNEAGGDSEAERFGDANKEDQTRTEGSNDHAEDAAHAADVDKLVNRSMQVIAENEAFEKEEAAATRKAEASVEGGDKTNNSPQEYDQQKDAAEMEKKDKCQEQKLISGAAEKDYGVGSTGSENDRGQVSDPNENVAGGLALLAEEDAMRSTEEKEERRFATVSAALTQQAPNCTSPITDTNNTVYSDQSPIFSAKFNDPKASESLKHNEGEDAQKCEDGLLFSPQHLDSEQEGFLFAKGEARIKESLQSSESLPAGDTSTKEQFMEQDLTSLSQFEAALISASDIKGSAASDLREFGNTSSMPSSELMEAAVAALAKVDVLAALSTMAHDQQKTSFFYSPWPKLSAMQIALALTLLLSLLGGLLCFVLITVSQDDRQFYLHPT